MLQSYDIVVSVSYGCSSFVCEDRDQQFVGERDRNYVQIGLLGEALQRIGRTLTKP